MVIGLLAWGTVVSLDLVSVGQFMVARPIVAGTVAGWIVGDPQAGFLVGLVLELFALEWMPFGASRYPDYGAGSVAAAAAAAGAPGVLGLGLAVTVGLTVALAGDVGIRWVRTRTTRDVRRHDAVIASGDARAIGRLHARAIARDALRGLGLAALGLVAAIGVRTVPPPAVRIALLLTVVAVGIGLGTAAVVGVRMARVRVRGWWWLGAGAVSGSIWVAVT